jgi:hypothetical protein
MTEVLVRIAWRTALAVAIVWLVWRLVGPTAMVGALPLFGVMLARPLIDLASALRHQVRAAVWRPVEGRHFNYRGTPVQVLEGDDHHRWVRAADVRTLVGHTASAGALALTYPEGWRRLGRPAEPHLRDDALLAHLAKQNAPAARRFRRWVEREIAFPAQRQRERLGVRVPAAAPAPAPTSPPQA